MRFASLAALALLAIAAATTAQAAPMPKAPQLMWAVNVSSNASVSYNFGYPAYSEGKAFIAASRTDGVHPTMLWAFDAFTGDVQWWVDFVASSGGMYVDAGMGIVFVGTLNGVYGINASTAEQIWFYNQNLLPHDPTAPDGHWPGKPSFRITGAGRPLVYVTWYDTPMVAIDAKTGTEAFRTQGTVGGRIWQTRRGFYFYQIKTNSSSAASSNTSPLAAAESDAAGYYLTRYDPLQRTPMWQRGPISTGYSTTAATADALASKIGINETTSELIIFDVVTGSVLRKVQANAHFDYSVAQGKIFQMKPQPDSATIAVDCYCGKTGNTLWSSSVPTTYRGSNVVASDNYILLQGATETWVLSAVDGTVLYSIATAAPSYGSVVDGDKYIMGFGGNAVGAFRLTIDEPMN